MALKKVSSGKRRYKKYESCTPGEVLAEGVFLGTSEGTYGIQFNVQEESGEVAVLNNAGHLRYLLEKFAAVGTYIQVTYAGKETLDKGKFKNKPAHKFELAVDDERAADASYVSNATKALEEDDYVEHSTNANDEDGGTVYGTPKPASVVTRAAGSGISNAGNASSSIGNSASDSGFVAGSGGFTTPAAARVFAGETEQVQVQNKVGQPQEGQSQSQAQGEAQKAESQEVKASGGVSREALIQKYRKKS